MGLDRRAFIGLAAGGAVGTLFTPIPWKMADDLAIWSQNWPWIPRVPKGPVTYAKTTSKMCPAGTGLEIMQVAGNPILAQGRDGHPLSQGAVSGLGASEVYMLYSPARVKTPMKKDGNGKFKPVTWEEAAGLLQEKCKAAGAKTACISGEQGGTANEVLSAFLGKLGSDAFFLMPSEAGNATKAWAAMGGDGMPGFDVDNADCVLVLGADIFETWGPSVHNRKAFDAAAPTGEKAKVEYIYAGPAVNNTASVCQNRVFVKPGDLACAALGIAWHLLKAGAPADAAFASLVKNYSPEKVEKACGIKPGALAAVAKTLAAAKAPLVIAGSEIAQGGSGAAFIAGMALNMLLDRINKPGGVIGLPALPKALDDAMDCADMLKGDLVAFLRDAGEGKNAPEALLVYEANPAYGLPEAGTCAKALEKIPFKVSFSSFMDETAAMCDLILPNSLTLERFDDAVAPFGTAFLLYSLVTPLTKPVYDTRTTADVILALAGKMNLSLGFDSFEDVLQQKAQNLGQAGGYVVRDVMPWTVLAGAGEPDGADEDLWAALAAGDAWALVGRESQSLSFAADILAEAAVPQKGDVILAPYAKLSLGTPTTGIPCQNLTTVPDTELLGNAMFVKMNSVTAGWFGVMEKSAVKISGAGAEITARVHICEDVMTGVVAAPLGFGHTAFDEYSRGKGENVMKVLAARTEPGTGLTVWDGAAVKIA